MKIVLKYQFLLPILAIKYQFLKVTKICQISFPPADIVQIHEYHVLAFINVPTKRKIQQGSRKFRIQGGPFNFQHNLKKLCRVYIVKRYLLLYFSEH